MLSHSHFTSESRNGWESSAQSKQGKLHKAALWISSVNHLFAHLPNTVCLLSKCLADLYVMKLKIEELNSKDH